MLQQQRDTCSTAAGERRDSSGRGSKQPQQRRTLLAAAAAERLQARYGLLTGPPICPYSPSLVPIVGLISRPYGRQWSSCDTAPDSTGFLRNRVQS